MNEIAKRIPGIDALRFFACCGILLLHFSNYSCPTGVWFGNTLIDPGETTSTINLNVMVEVFFFLSGFLIYTYAERIRSGLNFRDFFLPRLIRILPMLTVGTLFLVIISYQLHVSGCSYDISYTTPYLWGIISSCLGVSYCGIFTSGNINPASWYLDILLSCFVVFYLVVKLAKRKNINERYCFLIMILIGAACYAHNFSLPLLGQGSGRGYEAFFSGVLLASLINNKTLSKKWYILSFFVIIIYAGYTLISPELLSFGKTHLYNFFITPALIIILTSKVSEKIFSMKIWSVLGKISYSAYILHVPILFSLFLLERIFGLKIDYAHEVVFLFFSIIVFLISAFAYYFIEKPLAKLLHKKICRQ